MKPYDPLRPPNPAHWQALDEMERMLLVEAYHRRAHIELPDRRLHASMHVVVENQIAMGDQTPVRATLDRLMRQGLDRHDAIHAIGSVLARQIFDITQGRARPSDPEKAYYEQLEHLTAESWRAAARREAEEGDDFQE